MHRLNRSLLAAAVALCVLATACGGGSDAEVASDEAGFVVQGEQNVAVEATTTTTVAVDEAATGAGEGGVPTFDETESTIPTNEEEDPDGEFFDAVGDFMACLSTEGYGFLGIPNEDAGETAPVNDPGYIDALRGCAASSQIVAKMDAAEDTSDLTAEEIEESNRLFTLFVDCLKGRGWVIPDLTPDANGVLQTPYVEIAQTWTPPDGGSILGGGEIDTNDFGACGFTPDALN